MALLIGVLLVVQGILGLAAPGRVRENYPFHSNASPDVLAAVLRVVIGVVLVRAAPGSRAPRFLRVFGFIIIIGGLLTPFIGVWAAQHILGWWSAGGPAVVRVFAGVSLALGLLIVYAVARERRSWSEGCRGVCVKRLDFEIRRFTKRLSIGIRG